MSQVCQQKCHRTHSRADHHAQRSWQYRLHTHRLLACGEEKGRSAPRTWFEAAAAPRRRRSLDDRDGRTDGRRWPLARGELNPPSPCRALRCAGIASISLRLAAPERTSGQ